MDDHLARREFHLLQQFFATEKFKNRRAPAAFTLQQQQLL